VISPVRQPGDTVQCRIAVQTVSAGDASDIGLQPSAAPTQDSVSIDSPSSGWSNRSMQTISVKTLSGPVEMVIENYSTPKFRYYVSSVNTVIIMRPPFPAPKSRSRSQPSRLPLQVRLAEAKVQLHPSPELAVPPRHRSSSMPDIAAVRFTSSITYRREFRSNRPSLQNGRTINLTHRRHAQCGKWTRTKRFVRCLFCCAWYIRYVSIRKQKWSLLHQVSVPIDYKIVILQILLYDLHKY